jgi:sensor histidine kinase YesM
MEKYPFIFSNRFPYRLQRHLAFWFSWWMFSGFLYSFSAGILNIGYWERLPVSITEALIYLIPHVFLSYSLMYFVIPRFLLKAKYAATLLSVLGLFILTATLSSIISVYLLGSFRQWILGSAYVPAHINEVNFYLGLLSGLRGGITVGGIAAAIKLTKYWYMKEQRNLQLQKENLSSELQLLKAQVHPHFLFNTLNNIYANTQATSPQASKMIMGLSQLLRYMLYECNRPLVSLTRELKMLEEYIELEKSRYGNELDVHVEVPASETGLAIAPLLLLPFVENSFKHGASKMLDQPWISLTITVEDDWLKMKLLNGKTEEEASTAGGIGLTNVKKRLELLYSGKYDLQITNEEEVFIVNLKIQLEKIPADTSLNLSIPTAAAYA